MHTPGEWKISATGGDVVTVGNSDVLIGSNGHWIARLFHPDSHVPGTTSLAPPPEEVAANARLIAAAPKLLEALETIVAARDNYHGGDLTRAVDAARPIIAEAKGD